MCVRHTDFVWTAIGLVFNHPCWPEKHWCTINTFQSGTGRSTSRKISWFQMGEGVSSQRSIWSTEKIATFADWIIPCEYSIPSSFLPLCTIEFSYVSLGQGRGDVGECKEGSWFDQSCNQHSLGIGSLSSFPSSCIWTSGFHPSLHFFSSEITILNWIIEQQRINPTMLISIQATDQQDKFNHWMNWNNNWQQRKESPWFPSHFGGMEQNQGTIHSPFFCPLFLHPKYALILNDWCSVWLQQFERWDQMWWMIPW